MTSLKETSPGYSKAQKEHTCIRVPRILAMSHLTWINSSKASQDLIQTHEVGIPCLVKVFWLPSLKQGSLPVSAVDSCTWLYAPRGDHILSLLSVFSGSKVELIESHSTVVHSAVPLSSATCTTQHTVFVAFFRMQRSSQHADKMNECHKSSWLIIGVARFLCLRKGLPSLCMGSFPLV